MKVRIKISNKKGFSVYLPAVFLLRLAQFLPAKCFPQLEYFSKEQIRSLADAISKFKKKNKKFLFVEVKSSSGENIEIFL